MSSLENRCLDSFPAWLRALAEDTRELSVLLETTELTMVRAAAASALTYLTKSLDLIPDGLEELGYLDDAFVLRVAAACVPLEEREQEPSGVVSRLAADAELIAQFLGDDYARLTEFVAGLASLSARGHSVEQLLSEPEARAALAQEVRHWADGYPPPNFTRDTKSLVKVRAFLRAKLTL